MDESNQELEALSELASRKEQQGIRDLLMKHRPRLRRMVAARLDPQLAGRVDPSDIVQEVFLEAVKKIPEYVQNPPLPVYPWLRQLAVHRLSATYQFHYHAQRRSVTREDHVDLGLSDNSIAQLAGRLVSPTSSPSQRAGKRELQRQVREALDRLPLLDREVLVLRFVEQLTNRQTAVILGISAEAVGMRRVRALRRLSDELRRCEK